ncbi:hypothetical protein [Streptomyces rochei]|uniref:hypothetical protein n=1 Tax=Streptomyces rochei TaxID=1928 RepID=UPI0036C6A256
MSMTKHGTAVVEELVADILEPVAKGSWPAASWSAAASAGEATATSGPCPAVGL